MLIFLVGTFLILHGLGHLLYAAHSQRIIEMAPGLTWPDGSWVFSKLLSEDAARMVAGVGLLIITLGYVIAGICIYFKSGLWKPITIITSILSSLLFLFFWDGEFTRLPDKGPSEY